MYVRADRMFSVVTENTLVVFFELGPQPAWSLQTKSPRISTQSLEDLSRRSNRDDRPDKGKPRLSLLALHTWGFGL